jgi:multidrug resistance protein, MATE family
LFITIALMMGAIGALPAAAHQIAINVASVCFMVPLGIGMATTVRVGIAKGANDASGVRWAGLAGLMWVLGAQTITAIALAFYGESIASIYTRDTAVISIAVSLLWLAAIFQYADGIQALFNGALRGLKDTFWPMWITVLAYWAVGFVAAYWLGIKAGQGAQGFWIGLIVGLSAAALGLSTRFWLQTRRR